MPIRTAVPSFKSAAFKLLPWAIWSIIVVGTFVACSCGARTYGQSPAKDVIRLPQIRQDTVPQPMPVSVDSTVKLSVEVTYVVESDVECLVFLSPGGAVKVEKTTGPLRYKAKFADGTGVTETRTFAGKFLYMFDAIKDGRDEMIIVPVGAKSETDAKRVTFQVGQMPRPPTPFDPVTPVDPVKPVLTPFQQTLAAAIKADGAIPAHVTLYAAMWRSAATQTVNDPTITTGAELLKEMQSAVKFLGLPAGSLAKTSRAVADELNLTLAKVGKLDPMTRATIASLFFRVAADLDAAGAK